LPAIERCQVIYKPAEAAQRLRIGLKTLRQHIADGDIRIILIGKGKQRRHARIAESDILEFEARQKVQFSVLKPGATIKMSTTRQVYDFEAVRAEYRAKHPKARVPGATTPRANRALPAESGQ
jgi:hypothetical protein